MSAGASSGVRLASGVVLAVGTGLAVTYLTDLVPVLGFVVGLQVSLLTLQIESMLRERLDDQKSTRQNRIIAGIEPVQWIPDVVDKIVRSTAAVEQKFPNTIATEATHRVLENCVNELARLELGHVLFDYEEIGPLVAQADRSRRSIVSTSLQSVDLDWWLSPLGSKYWQRLQEAMRRGVHCERIFIYHDWNEDLDRLAREQLAGGVHVLRVHRDKLAPHLRLDLIIWDDDCGYETRSNERGEGQWNYFTFQAEEIRQLAINYNLIYNSSVNLEGDNRSCILH